MTGSAKINRKEWRPLKQHPLHFLPSYFPYDVLYCSRLNGERKGQGNGSKRRIYPRAPRGAHDGGPGEKPDGGLLRAERRKGPDTYWFHCLTNSRVEKDSCKGAMIQEKELISTVTDILEKELTVALGMSLPLFQLEARQKQEKDKLKIQMSAKRQEIEKTRRLIRGLYENFVQGILTNDEYFELKADYEHAINALSGEIEVFEKSMDSLDNQLARYRAMEKDAKTLAQDHVLTAELIERLIERIEIDHERNIHVTFRFKNEFQGKAVEPCATM